MRLEVRRAKVGGRTKSEIRNPKSEGNPKTEIRMPSAILCDLCALCGQSVIPQPAVGFRFSDFLRISDFGFRIFPFFLLSCALLRVPSPAGAAAPLYAEVYGRATNSFAAAVFYKPAEGGGSDLTSQLAPLVIQEVKEGAGAGSLGRDQFGALSLTNGMRTLDLARPAVYAILDATQLNGKPHTRLTYLWCYSLEHGEPGRGLPLQGIRITLDAAGKPAVWEVLAEDGGAELIFVSQEVESGALAEYGKPLPGRRYAAERSVNETPAVIVGRVLDEAPVAMGPMVYLRAGKRSVSTVTCRCMAAQVKRLTATRTYELRLCQGTFAEPLPAPARTPSGSGTAFWPGDETAGNRLDRCLRLPARF